MFDQQASTRQLHDNVTRLFKENFPFEYNEFTVDVQNVTFQTPNGNYKEQADAFMNETDLKTVVKGDLIVSKDGKEVVKSKQALFAAIPYATERGTYILGGNENVFINQMVLRPGIYVNEKKRLKEGEFIKAEIRAGKQRFTLTFNESTGALYIEDLGMDFGYNGKRVDAVAFLQFLGVPETKIKDAIGVDEVFASVMSHSKGATPEKIYKAFFEGEYPGAEEARVKINDYLTNNLTFDKKAQKVSEAMIGSAHSNVTTDSMLATIKQIFREYKEPGITPDVDDLRFKQVYNNEDVIAKGVERGIHEWSKKVKERIRRNQIKADKLKPAGYIQKQLKELYGSSLAELVDSGNPLDLHQKRQKLTMLGPGGLGDRSVKEGNRNLQDTAFGKIDPVETPQSQKLGSTQHISQDAEIKNGTIYSKFLPVSKGVIDHKRIIDDMDPMDEYNEYIAFNNPDYIEKGNVWKLKDRDLKVRHKGEFVTVKPSQVTLMDRNPSSHLGHATALIPFGAHNDGARMLMGASMQRQALALEDPDEPLVQSISDETDGSTMEEKMANRSSYLLRSPVDGTISDINENYIEVTDDKGKKVQVEKLNYFSTGKMGGYINHKPVVQVGDAVKKDGLVADGWQSKNGKMALGKNTLIAYMPFEGLNFEDGVVVSETFAKKMSSEELKTIEYELYFTTGVVPIIETKKKLKELLVSPAILSKLDANGVIKKGTVIATGDILVGMVKERKKVDASAAERLLSRAIVTTVKDSFTDRSKYVRGYQKGKVVDVNTSVTGNTMKVSIKLLAFKPMEVGDKLSGRHGNKGTITKIFADNEMPKTTEGRAIELIFSPLAVPSRKNLGQLLEVNAGLVAEKKGLPVYKVQNFDKTEKDRLLKELESIGMPDGKQDLINPKTNKPYENQVTVGPLYVMKLKHNVEGKISARNFDSEDGITAMPKKESGSINGDRKSPQGVGGMEFWSLTSAGAVHNIHEMTTLKSDGSGSAENKLARISIYEALRRGETIPEPVTPQTLKVMQEQLYGAGIHISPIRNNKEVSMDEKFTSLMLKPIHRDQLEQMAPGLVTGSKTFDGRTGEPDKQGLYSKEVFGDKGDKWGRIELGRPLPNPIFMESTGARPYEAMLLTKGITQSVLNKIVDAGYYIVLDPKDSGLSKYQLLTAEELEEEVDIEDKEFTFATGADALNKLLDNVDLKLELKVAELNLKGAKNKDQRSKAHKHVRMLSSALDHNYEPKDYLLPFVPVLPVKYREPVKANADKRIAEDGITLLYQNLMKKNQEYDRTLAKYDGDEDLMDRKVMAEIEADRYKTVKHIMGVGPKFVDRTKGIEYEGILHRLSGKEGFIREKMQKKLQDYSGRSVIVVDPELGMDEAGIPEDMAAEIFAPKIERALQKDKYTPTEIRKIMLTRDLPFRRALEEVAKDEVVILNRQPSLHRHSLQGFKPIIRWDGENTTNRAIGLNPLVTTAFNADFDGDTMAVHVPITEAAKKEVQEKLMPSQNLLNPTNNSIITELKHEMQLGLFYMTRDRIPTGVPKDYKDIKELRKAYDSGDVATYDAVRLNVPMKGTVTSTVGRHLFNSVLPPQYQDYDKNINMKKKDIDKILRAVMEDTKYGPMFAVNIINEWKNAGFKSATYSGVSIGIKDFDPVANIDKAKLFNEAEKSLGVANFIDNRQEFEEKKMEFVEGRIKDIIDSGVLGQDNPVEIMRASGARGNAGQIRSMSAVIGRGKNVSSESIRPVHSSLLEGTTPDEFWDLSNDSRKGIFDRSVASQKPGALTRYIWLSNKQTMVTKKDCGDTQGIILDVTKPADAKALHGRILLADIPLKDGGTVRRKKDVPITRAEIERVVNSASTPTMIRVRSALSCKVGEGVCQYCYGAKPGAMQNELVQIGEPIGSIAAQALGEPSQQAIMKTFHTGAGQSNTANSFERINEVLSLSEGTPNQSIVVEKDGIVKDITHDVVTGTTVLIGAKKYALGHRTLGDNIKKNLSIEAGDSLTQEFDPITNSQITTRSAKDVLKYQGLDATREHLTHQLELAFKSGDIDNIDRRHMEVVVGNMTNRAVVDQGGSTPFITEQRAPIKTLQMLNDSNSRVIDSSLDYGNRLNVIGAVSANDYYEDLMRKKPIVLKGQIVDETAWEKLRTRRKFMKVRKEKATFRAELQNVEADSKIMNGNWLEHAARGNTRSVIGQGTGIFMEDKLDNPLTRQMTGLKGNFGEGFSEWATDMKDRFGDMFI